MSEEKSLKKFYIPSCQKCKGLLNITINPYNFSISCECEYDGKHDKNDIFFKAFERFYLKSQNIYECSKCSSNLENSELFKCEICNNIYCSKCCINDILNNNHKNIVSNRISNRCPKHNWDFNAYCCDCFENICLFCNKNDNVHEGHEIIDYDEIIPSLKDIEILKIKFKEKIEYTNHLLKKIDNWKRIIDRKTEELKQNLKDEISLFEKIISNYNHCFLNYTYFRIFYTLDNYMKKINNEFLNRFNLEKDFEKQTGLLIQIFKFLGNLSYINCRKVERTFNNQCCINNGILERIYNSFFIIKDNYENNIKLCFYKDQKIKQCKNGDISFGEKVYSMTISYIDKKVLLCLLNTKKVKILDFSLKYKSLNLDDIEIDDTSNEYNKHFYKCIQITKMYLVTSDDKYIKIWKINFNNISQKKKFEINNTTYDLILANNEYFISSQPGNRTLILYDIKNLSQIKVISNICCLNSSNCLFKANNKNIIINCDKKIALFHIQTKEIVQYFEYDNSIGNCISIDDDNNIYLLNIIKNNDNFNNIS